MTDVCCLWEVRWRGQGSGMLGMEGRRHRLWWCGRNDVVGGVDVMVMEELCENMVQGRKVIDRVMSVVF